MSGKVLLIDGSSLLHRAFYALPLLSNQQGQYVNGVHGFMMMLNRLVAERQPQHIIVCFDKSRVTFRNQIYAGYKAQRAETPPELRGQFETLKQVLTAAHIDWRELDGYEADDLLGSYARLAVAEGLQTEIFSGDKDIFQLINKQVTVFMTRKGISEIEAWDEARFIGHYGFAPAKMTDFKGLMGDASDNIPGVPGVGEKTALKLMGEFGDIDGVYANLINVSGDKLRQKLLENKQLAYISKQLATIDCAVPLQPDWAACVYDPAADLGELRALYKQLGLRQLLRGLNSNERPSLTPAAVSAEEDAPWGAEDGPAAKAADKTRAEAKAAGEAASAVWRNSGELETLLTAIEAEQSCSLYAVWRTPVVDGQLEFLAIGCPDQPPYVIDFSDEDAEPRLQRCKRMLENTRIGKITAAAKELRLLLRAHDIVLDGLLDDVLIAAYLLDANAGEPQLLPLLRQNGLAADIETQAPAAQAAACVKLLPQLAALLDTRIDAATMGKLYRELELPLTLVLADMEAEGIRVREEGLLQMSELLQKQAEQYQQQIYAIAGHEFNLNSPKQLGVVLFEELGLPPAKKTKTGYSTDAEVLEALALQHPIAQQLLDYRLAAKLRSTYTEGLRYLINPRTGKLHTSFKQMIAATGRLSSAEPNLQNIPVRHPLGRKIREVFTADGEGDMLLAIDYNQIELRVLAHISADEGLIEAYRRGEDIHLRTASEVLGVSPEQITPLQRRQAKAVNFGIVYGISDYGLSRDIGVSRKEAAEYIARYFARYPGVAAYQREVVAAARRDGYVSTLIKRRRALPELISTNYNLRSFAERMAINTPIQGTAADIIKIAMLDVARELKARGLRTKMILQVHDELIFNMPSEEVKSAPLLLKGLMEKALPLSVPLVAEVKIGKDWYNMVKID
ncbi:MAG: DNA polymerase I [Bacillota bacterium]|nr:DNA polymerase I [Bacillota bacterium]